MAAALLILALTAMAVAALMWPGWRLQRAMAQPMPLPWQAILQRNLPAYRRMQPGLQHQLHKLVQHFLHAKKFIGCEGLIVSDEMRVTIAGHACMLLLGRPLRVYPDLHSVLVYPGAFLVPRKEIDAAGVVTNTKHGLLGESWGDGRVVLSWDHVPRAGHDSGDGHNVVLHEFAHQLDSESGSNNGAPLLGQRANYRRWAAVLSRDFEALQQAAMYQQQGVLDHYGATSPAEFFAVATETFFENPHDMAERHAELFEQFLGYYRVDPREWQAAPEPEPVELERSYAPSYWW
jgi:Mlc titration factor MtfA (ptsG expression regulator)